MSMADPVLVVRGLTKSFGSGPARVEALSGLDLTLHRGEFVAITGTSGSGKSTLLHLIAGLDEPSAGTIRLAGLDVASLGDDRRTRPAPAADRPDLPVVPPARHAQRRGERRPAAGHRRPASE